MDNHDVERQSLLSGLLDPPHQGNGKNASRRRRFRRCKTAPPAADGISLEVNTSKSIPHSQSVIGNLHPSFKQVAAFLSVYLGVGAICFYIVRHDIEGKKTNAIVDALYFCVVTMTTVGYGDLVPDNVLSKLLACAFVFSGMAVVGLILSKAADYLIDKQEALLVKALHMRSKLSTTDIMKKIETKRTEYKFILITAFLVVLIAIGTIFLVLVEKEDIVDAFYSVCCTITTLGYGDQSFSTEGGRIFAIVWILTSTICLAQFFLNIAELNTERRRRALVKWVLTRKVTITDLEAADIDNDGVVEAAEFILYKLKEMGKITQEDISLVMEEFEQLDVDDSGTLSISDITQAQSFPHPR
ncbi:hypothetical protein Ancab_014823 [Ancistrocladus abbreviatus]